MSRSRLNSLQTLKKLRSAESDQAKNDFASAITSEREIEAAIEALKADIVQNEEMICHGASDKDDQIIREISYYNWLAATQDQITQRKDELAKAKELTEQYRQKMISANTALEATETLMAGIKKELVYQEERRVQTEIDDNARRSFMHLKHKFVR